MSKILLVDDDERIAEVVIEVLGKSGYIVDHAASAEEAEDLLKGFSYDLLILDWVMPGMHGIELLARLRARQINSPVLMLTGIDATDNKVAGLDTGADDYLTKPFDRKEFLSRVKALLRRPKKIETSELSVSNVTIDPIKHKVTWHGKEIKVTPQEFQLLELLMRHKNEVFSHEALAERAWSSFSESSTDTVRVHMYRLRKKFVGGSTECPLRTVHSRGYVFADD